MRLLILLLVLTTLVSGAAALFERFPGDVRLAGALQEFDAAPWEETMETVSFLVGGTHMAFLGLVVALWLLLHRRKAEVYTALAATMALGMIHLFKGLIDRPRPPDDLVFVWQDFGGSGFPSGHAFSALVLFGLLYFLAPTLVSGAKTVRFVRGACVLLIPLTGLSRIWLGAHWPSDVMGGFLFGGSVLTLLVHFHRQQSAGEELSPTTQSL